MKNKLDLNQPIVLETYIPGQAEPLIINGLPELLIDLDRDVEQARVITEPKTEKVARSLAKPAVEAVQSLQHGFMGRIATNLKVVAYDKVHGTDFYTELRQKRADERYLKFAVNIGLISLSDVTCRKHEHAVAAMRGMS